MLTVGLLSCVKVLKENVDVLTVFDVDTTSACFGVWFTQSRKVKISADYSINPGGSSACCTYCSDSLVVVMCVCILPE